MNAVLRTLSFGLLLAGSASFCFGVTPIPEIDPSTGVQALALLSGAVLVIRARARR